MGIFFLLFESNKSKTLGLIDPYPRTIKPQKGKLINAQSISDWVFLLDNYPYLCIVNETQNLIQQNMKYKIYEYKDTGAKFFTESFLGNDNLTYIDSVDTIEEAQALCDDSEANIFFNVNKLFAELV